jgi:hypothetical protein
MQRTFMYASRFGALHALISDQVHYEAAAQRKFSRFNFHFMLPEEIRESELRRQNHHRWIIRARLAVDVMFSLQDHYGYLSDEALVQKQPIY